MTVEAVVAAVEEFQAPTIGTPNAGTFGYVLDSSLRMVPNGVVGELYLSGAQLARGYVGRPELTAARFVADPLRPGRRMYRTGDLVRRLPHGGYAYLGRGDTQVKIRGYRVEIGEIEAALRDRPEVHDAAVSVLRRESHTSLVGFVVWQQDADGDPVRLRTALAERLPSYMVPARIVVLPQLPVNTNGKLDGHALDLLAARALTRVGGDGAASASTDTERSLCDVFAEQFNCVTPHVDDDFFALGLDSIVAISLVHKARRLGLALGPRMVLSATTIRELAAAVDSNVGTGGGGDGSQYGEILPLPIVSWLYEYGSYRRFTHTVLLRLPSDIDRPAIELMLQLLLDGHDVLRSILVDTPDGPRMVTRPPGAVRAADAISHVQLAPDADLGAGTMDAARAANDHIDPRTGAMLHAVWLSGGGGGQTLLIAAHHLTVDVVSWHIMLGDITEAWRSVRSGTPPKILPEVTSYRRWSELMWQRAAAPGVQAQREYWTAQVRGPDPALGTRHPDPTRDTWSTLRVVQALTPVDVTERVLATLTRDEGMTEFSLAALTMAVASLRRTREQDSTTGTLITMESHGRADATVDTDTTNTVGWFNAAYPVRLGAGTSAVDVAQAEDDPDAARMLFQSVADHLRAIPNDGLDYGLLRYVDHVTELQAAADPQITFSYLGRLDLTGATDQPWSLVGGDRLDALPVDPEPDLPLRFGLCLAVSIRGTAQGPQLTANWLWSDAVFERSDIERLTHFWERGIATLAAALARRA
jgi:mycobactin peptide synthetase MbtF